MRQRARRDGQRWVALVLALTLCGGLAGCAGADGAATSAPAPRATVSPGSAGVLPTVTPGGPTATPLPGAANLAGATDICASPVNVSTTLPPEIPPYSGGQLRLAQTNNGAGVFGYCAVASVDAIAAFYAAQLPGKGWSHLQSFPNGSARNLIATRGAEGLTITVSPDVTQTGSADLLIIVTGL